MKTELGKIEKKLLAVIGIMDADPIGRILEIRKEAQNILEENQGDHAKMAELIEPLAKEEKQMFALSRKQIKPGLVEERVHLGFEKYELINAIYYAERK